MSMPVEFSFEGKGVRVVMIDCEPWWVAVDVCRVLDIANSRDAVERLDDDEKADVALTDTSSNGVVQRRQFQAVNESGLYTLILRCRDAVNPGTPAHRFRKWVTNEVLPALRRNGMYRMPFAQPDEVPAPLSARVEADEIVSAGRAFRSLFTTARYMGMPRKLAATRANLAAQRATGVDLAAELSASGWLESSDLPAPQQKQYEMQQQIRTLLQERDWPQDLTVALILQGIGRPDLVSDRATQILVGQCMLLLGYRRVRLPASRPNGIRPWGYRMPEGRG